jgi:transposase
VVVEGQPVARLARELWIGRRTVYNTVYKWVHRHRAEGEGGLRDRSSRPRRIPRQLSREVMERIERLRRRRYTELRIAEELGLAVSTVSRWLRRLGLGRLRNLGPRPVVIRYERKAPGDLLHIDTKKLGRIQGV